MTTLEKMRYDATSLNEVEGIDKRVCAPNYGWDWKMEAINISKIIETKQCLQNTIHQHKHFVVESLGFITNFTHARTCKFWCSFFRSFCHVVGQLNSSSATTFNSIDPKGPCNADGLVLVVCCVTNSVASDGSLKDYLRGIYWFYRCKELY